MDEQNRRLYDYLMSNLPRITDEWIAQRNEKLGSIYSKNMNDEIEALLRSQNKLTNETVASALLDESLFCQKKENWALIVAGSRAKSNTPIHEVLDALSKVRSIYWRFVGEYADLHPNFITQKMLLNWTSIIHGAFDQLQSKFAHTYYLIMNKRLSAQAELIEELSSPVIPVTATNAILPLIGDIDTLRAQFLLESIPAKCSEVNIEHLYIDLSGVSIIDTMVAQKLYQLTEILSLLGIECLITGIRPEIAQTSVQLGLDFKGVSTFSSLQQALSKHAFELGK
ncbi:rsbT co-antagonist protein RsbR [Bacillus sp. OV322]|uniref:STAS domain-containing protein n=1 Tax=Bacillus sp. OV322 TaxID=1882764 RepID=UPI0008E7D465|nr:STAS domain-containing protein [Bacillus sp. OV322]SFC72810.1 rsbT co-antagonist protein RsbR [Bacillus sp. OV322]